MNKPFSLIVNETKEQIVNVVNNANLPAFCLKVILNDILNQINQIDEQEIKKYNEELNKEEKEEK